MTSGWLTTLIVLTIVTALGLGAYSIARSPKFYAQLIVELLPLIGGVFKRMSPEQESKLHASVRRAQEWDNFRKRPRQK